VSPQRIDYYDSPGAPKANSLVPAVNVVVVNDAGEILMIRRTDNDNWAVPGGAVDLGESVAQAAVRETLEESGIECAITGIVGIYSDPRHVILYTSNGEVRQEFSIALTARLLAGQPTPSSESSEVRWVAASALPSYTMDRSMRIRINDFLAFITLVAGSRTAAAPTVSAWPCTDLRSGLQSFDVPGELRCDSRRDAPRDRYVVDRLGKVGQGPGDNLFCFTDSERVPAFCLADEVDGADTPMVEAAVDGEREVSGGMTYYYRGINGPEIDISVELDDGR
jgi:ADP-ribose pyrophosphatase YjhB (NUDIX family)